MGLKLMGRNVTTRLVKEPTAQWSANYGTGSLCLNYSRLGKRWFGDATIDGQERVNDLLIHEFAHQYSGDHFSHKFLNAITKLGAQLGQIMYHRGLSQKDIWEE
jgi:hypothetical protein